MRTFFIFASTLRQFQYRSLASRHDFLHHVDRNVAPVRVRRCTHSLKRDGRFAAVEPVFGNLRGNKRLDRFTLRGRGKVDGQWKLYCMVHNIEKLAHHGYAL